MYILVVDVHVMANSNLSQAFESHPIPTTHFMIVKYLKKC